MPSSSTAPTAPARVPTPTPAPTSNAADSPARTPTPTPSITTAMPLVGRISAAADSGLVTSTGWTAPAAGELQRPIIARHHERLIGNVYPAHADEPLNAAALAALLDYVAARPVKITKVGRYLERHLTLDLQRRNAT